MCMFTSDKDIPPYVRISTRTLQYFLIPLLSIAIIAVGSQHLEDCAEQKNLAVWHIVAGCSGLLVPTLYLLFDKLNPRLASSHPTFSGFLDNAVLFTTVVFVLFEVSWLITGTVWIAEPQHLECKDSRLHTFSVVVIINFWIHLLTPVAFIISVSCSRLFPYCAHCAYFNIIKNAIKVWTFKTRLFFSFLSSFPLGCAMIGVGINGLFVCQPEEEDDVVVKDSVGTTGWLDISYITIPVWLIISGSLLLLLPAMFTLYARYSKNEEFTGCCFNWSISIVIFYLLCALAWAVIGFMWILGNQHQDNCDTDSFTYKFASGSLIVVNVLMDIWICMKISVVLYWSILHEDE